MPYFDKQNIREKANFVGEKELYGLYYDYDSAYEKAVDELKILKIPKRYLLKMEEF